jgi:hypothetical protein
MSQRLRLSQFFRLRIVPLLERLPNFASTLESRDRFTAEFYEVVGWLNEGVFCGFFNPKEADILWLRLRELKLHCGSPSDDLVVPVVAEEIERLFRTDFPFHASTLMPDGMQKQFELPLFPHVLHLSDRWADDSLAMECTSFLISKERRGTNIQNPDLPVRPSEVASALNTGELIGSHCEDLLAGFIQMLQHMDESRTLFQNAHNMSHPGIDFDSYRLRIGSLNAWRVPLFQQEAKRKMDQLFDLLEFALRASIKELATGVEWSSVEQPLKSKFQSLMESWETNHLLSSLELA